MIWKHQQASGPSVIREEYGKQSYSHFTQGGYLVLRSGPAWGMVRCPAHFRHRPSHADLLHLDLWHKGENILGDGGTYSYNSGTPVDTALRSVEGHNTIQFDDHDQMPSISRFLYGRWATVNTVQKPSAGQHGLSWGGKYEDAWGCSHQRGIQVSPCGRTWTVEDNIAGFARKAVLRWRLSADQEWFLKAGTCTAGGVSIEIIADHIQDLTLTGGWESLYYLDRREVSILVACLPPHCRKVTSRISLLPAIEKGI